MRYSDFRPRPQRPIGEQELSELRQSPGAYASFLKSPAAAGMQAGFEAELIFQGLGGEVEGELEPDYDEDTSPSSIDEIVDFFPKQARVQEYLTISN